MVLYKCCFCGFSSKGKINIERHLLKKNKCSIQVVTGLHKDDILVGTHYNIVYDKKYDYIYKNDRYYCKRCMKCYKSQSGFSLHNKKCKIENPVYEEESIKDENPKVSNNSNINNNCHNFNNTNTVNITNNNTNIIVQPLPYGKEDLSHVKGLDIKRLVDKYELFEQDIIAGFTKYVHFNENKPENHNIRVLGNRDNIKIYLLIDDGQWEEYNKDIIGNRITGDKIDQLYEKSNVIEMPKKQKQDLEAYFDKHSRILPGIGTDNIDYKIEKLMEEQLRIKNEISILMKSKELKTKEI